MIAIISHDSGGAEVLSSYVASEAGNFIYSLDGPAESIFRRKLGHIDNIKPERAIQGADRVLLGTSWPASFEWQALQLAKSQGKYTVSFLDHWTNYKARFVRNNKVVLPDELWVGDTYAKAMAEEAFPNTRIVLKENPYLNEIQMQLKKVGENNNQVSNRYLYVCEPIEKHCIAMHGNPLHKGYTEYTALRYFLDNIHACMGRVDEIIIRLHPSEPKGKYDKIIEAYSLPIRCSSDTTLLEEVSRAEAVFGCNTMAMVVALLANKSVVCCIPPGGEACVLPHEKIKSIQELVVN